MRRNAYTKIPHNSKNDIKSLRRILPYLSKYKLRVILALSSLIIAKFANIGIPVIFKDIVDTLNAPSKLAVLLPISLIFAYGLMRASSALFNELRDTIFAKVRYNIMRKISVDMLEHLHKLSLKFHLNRQTGAITRDLERGTRSVNSLMNLLLFNIIPILVEVILIAVILLINYKFWFMAVTLLTVIFYGIFTIKITEWRIKFRVTMNKKESEASNHALDSIINFETVKYFNNEKYELQQYQYYLDDWAKAGISSQTSMSALNFGQAFIIAIGVTAMMLLASIEVINKQMTLGDLVLVNTFMLQLFIPLGFLGIAYSQIKHALIDIRQMFALFDEDAEIVDTKNAKTLISQQSTIEFDKVSFAYTDERPILNQLSFIIPHLSKVAIVGKSGSGKSTITRLLLRLYETKSGSIKINHQNINAVSQASLRATIGVVPQDTILFNDTIEYNISYSKIAATKDEIITAAKQANIHSFIMSLPEQYQTKVGERGLKLSGGEKQRVAIARALLKQPQILVFDEATSSLDTITEQEILAELKTIANNHTTLVIAHRLSTIADSDVILVLKQGQITESGSHQNLLATNGHYADLWHKQQNSNRLKPPILPA